MLLNQSINQSLHVSIECCMLHIVELLSFANPVIVVIDILLPLLMLSHFV
jgi:hypothetical protein